MIKDAWHYTIDLKDEKMKREKTHLTVHGYIENPHSGAIVNMYDVTRVIPKTDITQSIVKVEQDSYYDRVRGMHVNNWTNDELEELDEPPELKTVSLGDNFITALGKLEIVFGQKDFAAAVLEAENKERKARNESDESRGGPSAT